MKVSMTTYRSLGGSQSSATDGEVGRGVPTAPQGDTTLWLRDEATGLVTNKVYADGKGPTYTYTPDGKLATRTWARGIVTTYSYDDNGALTNTVYSDSTPAISLAYNRAGQQIQAIDAAGVTTFVYDDFGALTNEMVVGVAGTNTIERFYDSFGRDAGYALNGVRQSTLAYDPATGRLATMLANGSDTPFTWNYVGGSDLKSSLLYPNGLTASWQYDANSQLLQVCNAFPTNIISQYDYTYDAACCRINMSTSGTAFDQNDSIGYSYNSRSELTNAVAAVDSDYRYAYDFDDVGNRESSSERGTNSIYTVNSLNQYTAITDVAAAPSPSHEATFVPQFDDDGNQTLIKTSTGIWSVTYNGENRPVLWTLVNSSTPSLISMSFDRMGRRVTKNAQRFVYNGYLQIANFERQTSNIKLQTFIWDPTEPVATRPIVWNRGNTDAYYCHDGNKNVSEVVAMDGAVSAHYEYSPFGIVLVMHGESAFGNPWRFSSEYAEDNSATIYYNYRHYVPNSGRWLSRDPIEENGGIINIYSYLGNTFGRYSDCLGKFAVLPIFQAALKSALIESLKGTAFSLLTSWYDVMLDNGHLVNDAMMSDCGREGMDDEGFHLIKLYSPRSSSSVNKSLMKGLKSGSAAFLSQFAAGSLGSIIRSHADEFLTAKPGSLYYKYYKKIEKLITKEGAKELSDEMVDKISELAVSEIGNVSSLINGLNVVPDEVQKIKWTVEDNCRICAIIKESFTIDITIMGEKESIKDDGPERTLRCFDYKELGEYGIVGRNARKACNICPCKKKKGKK